MPLIKHIILYENVSKRQAQFFGESENNQILIKYIITIPNEAELTITVYVSQHCLMF